MSGALSGAKNEEQLRGRQRARTGLGGMCGGLHALLLCVCVPLLLSVSARVHAQGVDLNLFAPSPIASDGFVLGEPGEGLPGTYSIRLFGNYAHRPFVLERRAPDTGDRVDVPVVEHHLVTHIVAEGQVSRTIALFGELPVHAWQDGDSPGLTGVAAADGQSLGDLRLGLRFSAMDTEHVKLGGQLQLHAPLAYGLEGANYAGTRTLRFTPEFLGSFGTDRFRVSTRLGVALVGVSEVVDTRLGTRLSAGVGARLKISETVALHAETYGYTTFLDFGSEATSPVEALVGLTHTPREGFTFSLGGAMGLLSGFGSPEYRGVLSMGYRRPGDGDDDGDGWPNRTDPCPDSAEDEDGFEDDDGCEDPDNDQDGYNDIDDRCPMVPEDEDGYDDWDGCPEPDNDYDRIDDVNDRCPLDPEDMDGFEDEDGCSDPDNDQDGIPDRDDPCPMVKGVSELQGCPTPDRDADDVPDTEDNCPDTPGQLSFHGCSTEQLVYVKDARFVLAAPIEFVPNKPTLLPSAAPLLDNIAAVMKARADLGVLEVGVHTDDRGSAERNLAISQRRARELLQQLVKRGVDTSRVTAEGFGPSRPLLPGARTMAERAKNARVEFLLPAVAPRSASGAEDGTAVETAVGESNTPR